MNHDQSTLECVCVCVCVCVQHGEYKECLFEHTQTSWCTAAVSQSSDQYLHVQPLISSQVFEVLRYLLGQNQAVILVPPVHHTTGV